MRAFSFLFLATFLHAQVPVAIRNAAGTPRHNGWVTIVAPDKGLPERPVLKPFNWPVFYGGKAGAHGRLIHIRTGTLAALEQVQGMVVEHDGTEPDTPAILLEPENPATVTPAGNALPVLIVETGAGAHRWTPGNLHLVDTDPARTVFHARGRVPGTMLVANMWFYVYTASRVVPFELFLVNCDQSSQEWRQDVASVRLETIPDIYPAVDFLHARGGSEPVNVLTNTAVGDVVQKIKVQLVGPTWIGHGQGIAWVGRLVFWATALPAVLEDLNASREAPILGMALNWQGNWGPWGIIPDLHPKEDTQARRHGMAAAEWIARRFVNDLGIKGTPWTAKVNRWGLGDKPSGTGNQEDFGITKMAEALSVRAGNPYHLWQVVPSVLRDGGRPTFYYEQDATPLKLELHPQWMTWGYTTHYISKDQLGKGPGRTRNTLYAKDFAHCSSNNLAGWTVLTGSHLGQHILRHEITAGCAYGKYFGLGEIRAFGRTPLAMVWAFLATGDTRVSEIFLKDLWADDDFEYAEQTTHNVALLKGPSRPDGRHLGGKVPFWLPWQEALAIHGLDAALKVRPSPRIEAVLRKLCPSYIKWGWWKLDSRGGAWMTFWDVRWVDGSGLTNEQYQTTDYTYVAPGDWGITKWSWPSVKIAKRYITDPELLRKCDEIDAHITKVRNSKEPSPYAPIGFDRESCWKGAK